MKRLYSIVLTAILISLAISAIPDENVEREILTSFENENTKTLFEVFNLVYKKSYKIDSEEGLRRFKIFESNLDYIKSENTKGHSYELGYNHLMDYTFQELESMYLSHTSEEFEEQQDKIDEPKGFFDRYADDDDYELRLLFENEKKSKKFFDSDDNEDADEMKLKIRPNISSDREVSQVNENQNIPRTSFDWKSKFLPPRDQKECGCCWAFSAAGTIEANWAIKNNLDPNDYFHLSTQQLVDCDKESDGCNGGFSVTAMKFYSAQIGLIPETSYPYKALAGTCQIDSINQANKVKVSSVSDCSNCTIEQWYALLQKGPIVISSFVTRNWFFYKSGIFSVSNCNSKSPNHAIIAVGWGVETDPNGKVLEYTIIRNSWGTKWGEGGYMRIKYQPDLKKSCFINTKAALPIF